MAIGDIYKVALVQKLRGHAMVNTFHYVINQPPTSGDVVDAIHSGFSDIVMGKINNVQSVQVANVRIEIQKVFPAPIFVRRDYQETGGGTNTQPAVSDAVALVVRRKSVLAGRRKRGRIYVGGVSSSLFDTATGQFQILNITTAALLEATVYKDLSNSPTNFSASAVLFDRKLNLFTPLVTGFFDPIPRTQRRRQLDIGI
jgi:hypothetical protein